VQNIVARNLGIKIYHIDLAAKKTVIIVHKTGSKKPNTGICAFAQDPLKQLPL
jgi:hypothetical protein